MKPTLELGARGEEVEELHLRLRAIGYLGSRDAGGDVFDEFTEVLVRAYQSRAGLAPDGKVGPITGAALLADVRALGVPEFGDFRGRLGFLVGWEGHAGRPYWPSGRSGLTLDPGFDLGYHTAGELRDLFDELLVAADFEALELAIGIRGALARELVHDPRISRVRIGRLDAARVLPRIAAGYWRAAVAAVPALVGRDAPAGAHTALLSLCYNAGADDLGPLRAPAAAGDWRRVAELLAAKHASSASLSRRRRAEAALLGTPTVAPASGR